MNNITVVLNSQQVEFLNITLNELRKENISASSNVISQMILDKINGVVEKECEQGHTCTSGCQKDFDCPCESDHCCSMSSKDNLCGDTEECEFCASKVPDLADLANDNLNER